MSASRPPPPTTTPLTPSCPGPADCTVPESGRSSSGGGGGKQAPCKVPYSGPTSDPAPPADLPSIRVSPVAGGATAWTTAFPPPEAGAGLGWGAAAGRGASGAGVAGATGTTGAAPG